MEIRNYYEEFEDSSNNIEPVKKLFYAIMYRRWDKVACMVEQESGLQSWGDVKNECFNDGVTLEDCIKLNLDFLKDSKNEKYYEKLSQEWGDEFKKQLSSDMGDMDYYTYDDKRFHEKKTAFDIFWEGNQPVLNLYYLEKQTIPARQVMNKGCSMVLDEVGTGKTVAGIFTIQQVIQKNIDEHKNNETTDDVNILVVCPSNKKEDWYSDILRQLGRKSVIIEQEDNGENIFKKSYKRGIPHIFISGNKGGDDNGSSQQLKLALKNSKKWDLVIIDECHSCFDNYCGIRAERALLLTATPIVVSSKGVREFSYYENLLNKILGGDDNNRIVSNGVICPIEKRDYSDEDIFTCNFKEDLFSGIEIKRDIHFIDCARNENRQEWFNKLRYEKDFFTAIFADQDDNRLVKKMKDTFPDSEYQGISNKGNKKIDRLKEIIKGDSDDFKDFNTDSFIIFCETTGTVDFIYNMISGDASSDLMIGKLHGEVAEIKNHFTNKDIIMSMLKKNIRDKKRSILITTGKSGGTGLNLGEFDTVVHYELPFSSNDLEQRFGRIERADDLLALSAGNDSEKKKPKKMVFLMNEPVDGESDFETNRMLYYAINKINITVAYMPIRNTVLFHPEYIRRVKCNALEIWKEVLCSLDNEADSINKCCEYYNDRDIIVELECIKKIDEKPSVVDKVDEVLNNTNSNDLEDDDVAQLIEFHNKYIDNKNYISLEEDKHEIDKYIEYYLWLTKTISFWKPKQNETDIENIEKEYFEATAEETSNESVDSDESVEEDADDDKKNKENSDKLEWQIKNIFDKIRKYSDQERSEKIKEFISELINRVKLVKSDNEYSGVFYRKDGHIFNKTFVNGADK